MSNLDRHTGLMEAAAVVTAFHREVCANLLNYPVGFTGSSRKRDERLKTEAETLLQVMERIADHGQAILNSERKSA